MNIFRKYLTKHRPICQQDCSVADNSGLFIYVILGVIIFILIWAAGGYAILSQPDFKQFSGFLPIPTIKALVHLSGDPSFWHAVTASLRRISVGIGIAFILGMPSGLLIGYFRKIQIASYTPIQFIRMISPLAWMPIAMLIFKTFESAIYFLITMATVWPILLNTVMGVERVNIQWLQMAKIQGAKPYQIMLYVVLPASTPYIITSLRLALGVAWIVLVPVEFLGVSSGLGYIINDARDTMEYDRLMAIVVAIGIIGFILDGSIQLIRQLFRWNWSK
ncbi:MAG: ABC transporter permease [Deltaproteobacteria bacterium]|nr:ABC transporter permease [Deltaproteobacteria bacterium]